MFVSPSRLSRLIQKLEEEVGASLFERDNRTVKLTRAGELYRDYALNNLTSWEALCNLVQRQTTALKGHLSVFCSVTASYYFLENLLERFRSGYPEVEIHLHTGDTALTIPRILGEKEDIGIAARPDKLPATLLFKTIGESPLVFIAPAIDCPISHRLKSMGKTDPRISLDQFPLILSETGLARSRVNHWFREQGIKPDIYAQVAGNEAIVSMVSLGFGVGVVPRLVVENSPVRRKVEILPIKPNLEPFSIGICVLKRKLSNPLIRAFWDLVPGNE